MLRDLSGIKRTAQGEPVLSAEAMVFAPLADQTSGREAFVTLRGIGAAGLLLRPEIHLVEGRMFRAGARELVIGRAVRSRMKSAVVGSNLILPQGAWSIVGVYESGGDSRESEMLTDAETLMSAYRKTTFNTVTLSLDGAAALDRLRADLAARPDQGLEVMRESEFIARSSGLVTKLLQLVAFGVGAIMAVGAMFGAVNTMFTAVSVRSSEIGTLRALGFGPGAVVSSVLVESLLLALSGAVFGTLLAWLFLNGRAVSMLSGTGPSQVSFDLQIDAAIVVAGIAAAILIGAIGGALPALRAGMVSIAEAIRSR
jgi:putative ABC transport system permease protein